MNMIDGQPSTEPSIMLSQGLNTYPQHELFQQSESEFSNHDQTAKISHKTEENMGSGVITNLEHLHGD